MGLKTGQEASFSVQLNGARGLIDAKIHSPSGAVEECHITELDSGETFKYTWSSARLQSESSCFLSNVVISKPENHVHLYADDTKLDI